MSSRDVPLFATAVVPQPETSAAANASAAVADERPARSWVMAPESSTISKRFCTGASLLGCLASMVSSEASIGVGVVGAGPWGLNVARAIARTRGAPRVGIADLDPERHARAGAERGGLLVERDLDRLLATCLGSMPSPSPSILRAITPSPSAPCSPGATCSSRNPWRSRSRTPPSSSSWPTGAASCSWWATCCSTTPVSSVRARSSPRESSGASCTCTRRASGSGRCGPERARGGRSRPTTSRRRCTSSTLCRRP